MLLLQVFVFSRTAYSMIKERLKSKGVADITAKELEGYFSPWHAKHIGQVKVIIKTILINHKINSSKMLILIVVFIYR